MICFFNGYVKSIGYAALGNGMVMCSEVGKIYEKVLFSNV
jgi:hypothetical protein